MWVFKTLPFGWSYSPLLFFGALKREGGVGGGGGGGACDALFGRCICVCRVSRSSNREIGTFKKVLVDAGVIIGDKLSVKAEHELVLLSWLAAGAGKWCIAPFRVYLYHRWAPAITRRRHAPCDEYKLAEQRGRPDHKLVAVHRFAKVTEAATTSYKTRTRMLLPVVMRICRRVQAA